MKELFEAANGRSPMKRWQGIVWEVVGGLLIVLAIVVNRLRQPQGDWRDVAHDLGGLGLFILMNAAMLLAIIAIFWGGYLWLRKPPENRIAEPQSSVARRMLRVVEAAVLSVVMALAATGLSKMRTPGWWVAGTLNKPGPDLNLGLFIGSAIVVDSAICFAILWGGYLLWMRIRRKDMRRDLRVGY